MTKRLTALILLLASSALLAEQPVARIIGGEDAPEQRWPWMSQLMLFDKNDDSRFFVCGASLISPHWLVTAAHCIEQEDGTDTPPGDIRVFIGDSAFNNNPNRGIPPIGVHKHPQYQPRSDQGFNRDLALIQLGNPADAPLFASIADATRFQQLENASASNLNNAVTALGWGETDDGSLADLLQEVQLDYLPRADCRNISPFNITNFMLCAWEPTPPSSAPNGQDVCFGDSGGPLIIGRERAPWLLGVTSFGTAICASGSPSIFTDLQAEAATLEQLSKSTTQPLIDLQLQANTGLRYLRPDQSLSLTVQLHNNSIINTASNITVDARLQGHPDTQLTLAGTGCNGVHCYYPETLTAGSQQSFSAKVDSLSNDDKRVTLTLEADANEEDYRLRTRRIDKTLIFSLQPHLFIRAEQTRGQLQRDGRGVAEVAVSLRNASTINQAEDALLAITLPSATVLDNAAALGCSEGNPLRCPLGTLSRNSEQSLILELITDSPQEARLDLRLSSSNGNFPTGDEQTQLLLNYDTPPPRRRSGGTIPFAFLMAVLIGTAARRFLNS